MKKRKAAETDVPTIPPTAPTPLDAISKRWRFTSTGAKNLTVKFVVYIHTYGESYVDGYDDC